MDGKPKLYQTEPSGAYNEWKANAIGRNASNLREFLEKKWEPEMGNKEAIKLSIETLLEVVEDAKNIVLHGHILRIKISNSFVTIQFSVHVYNFNKDF